MYEHLSVFLGGPPNASHFALYSRWAKGDWGMIVTGNVQVARDHLTLGRDMVVPEHVNTETLAPFKELASIIHGDPQTCPKYDMGKQNDSHRPLAVMQLSHAGRQSANIVGGRWPFVPPVAPSAVPLDLAVPGESRGVRGIAQTINSAITAALHAVMFQRPRPLSVHEIDDVARDFVKGAQLAERSGFDGVELHASHGYLIAQFISPKSNHRADGYSAISSPLGFLHHIVSLIRSPGVVSDDFILGVKLNAGDYNDSELGGKRINEDRALQHVKDIALWGMVDFIEISGGDYEDPGFMAATPSPRQALFSGFSRRAMQVLDEMPLDVSRHRRPHILLTGGLRTPELICSVLSRNHADLLGIGRHSVLYPELPKLLSEVRTRAKRGAANDPRLDLRLPPSEFHLANPGPLVRVEEAATACMRSLWRSVPPEFRLRLPKLVGAGMEMATYVVGMRVLATGLCTGNYVGDGADTVLRMWLYVAPGSSDGKLARQLKFGACMGLLMLILVLCV